MTFIEFVRVQSVETRTQPTLTLWNAWKPLVKVWCAVIVSSITRLTINGSSGIILLRKLPISAPIVREYVRRGRVQL